VGGIESSLLSSNIKPDFKLYRGVSHAARSFKPSKPSPSPLYILISSKSINRWVIHFKVGGFESSSIAANIKPAFELFIWHLRPWDPIGETLINCQNVVQMSIRLKELDNLWSMIGCICPKHKIGKNPARWLGAFVLNTKSEKILLVDWVHLS